jgi:hypothetical protein
MEIMFIDNGPPKQTFGSEHKLKRFADGRFTDVVPSDQEGVAVEIDDAMRDASKIRNGQPPDAHRVVSA